MAFFSQMGQQPGVGMGGSPSAFTSPGMDPAILAMLMHMQNGGGGGGGGGVPSAAPQMPAVPTSGAGGAIPTPPGLGAGPEQGNPMLQQLLQNPQLLKQLLGMMGMGGGGGAIPAAGAPANLLPGMGGGGMPGPGTGGSY